MTNTVMYRPYKHDMKITPSDAPTRLKIRITHAVNTACGDLDLSKGTKEKTIK